jgi:hypothetical protein
MKHPPMLKVLIDYTTPTPKKTEGTGPDKKTAMRKNAWPFFISAMIPAVT